MIRGNSIWGTLGRYIFKRFGTATLTVFLTCAFLIYVVDFIELIRRGGDREGVTLALLATMSLYRLPALTEQLIPFAVLFGSMGALLGMSRKLELAVARAAGVSVWQFLSPGLGFALLLGIALITLFNPLAAHFKDKADGLEAKYFSSKINQAEERGVWFRQEGADGQSVFRAQYIAEQGRLLTNVTIFTYDINNKFVERIEAKEARFEPGFWDLREVRVSQANGEPQSYTQYTIPTRLSYEQVESALDRADSISFWRLEEEMKLSKTAGFSTTKLELQYQTLLARPLLLAAMVLIAATVSLRIFRFGNIGGFVLGGVTAGFVLYVVMVLAEDLGRSGVVAPVIAAWSPVCIGLLLGLTVLLNQEDG